MDQEFLDAVKLLSPGTSLRNSVNYILQGGLGGLVVLSDAPEVLALIEGGFHIDCEFTPMRLFELSKMDGGVILSEDLKRIVKANAYINANNEYKSKETGTRHQTAEKFSKQTNKIVLTISQRRHVINMYLGDQKYMFRDMSVLISTANQTMLALGRHLESLNEAMKRLHLAELNQNVTLLDVVTLIQYNEIARRTQTELERHKIELGTEVQSLHLDSPELERIIENSSLVVKDYYHSEKRTEEKVFERLSKLDDAALLDSGNVSVALGYPREALVSMDSIEPRGYRILSQIPRLPWQVIEKAITNLGSISAISNATMESLRDVKGIGKVRAQLIHRELERMGHVAKGG